MHTLIILLFFISSLFSFIFIKANFIIYGAKVNISFVERVVRLMSNFNVDEFQKKKCYFLYQRWHETDQFTFFIEKKKNIENIYSFASCILVV